MINHSVYNQDFYVKTHYRFGNPQVFVADHVESRFARVFHKPVITKSFKGLNSQNSYYSPEGVETIRGFLQIRLGSSDKKRRGGANDPPQLPTPVKTNIIKILILIMKKTLMVRGSQTFIIRSGMGDIGND